MIKLLPKWLFKRYIYLSKEFQNKPFTLQEAQKQLKKNKINDSKEILRLILSELRKAGWLKAILDEEDARKRQYQLIALQPIIDKYIEERK